MKAKATLISITPNAESLIARARWVCRASDRPGRADSPEEVRAAIEACLASAHLTPLEFGHATFEITCTRACSHQLVRHRTASFCQESQRGTSAGGLDQGRAAGELLEDLAYDNMKDSLYNQVSHHFGNAERLYHLLLTSGLPKERARFVLTQMSLTRLWMTSDFRNLLHFLRLRLHPSAQDEIRSLAMSMQEQLVEQAPSVFNMEAICSFKYAPDLTVPGD
jgi:thymidylate synthase (FAD)